VNEHRKLIPAQSGDSVFRSYCLRQTRANELQQLVTGAMSKGVVHFLKAVEIDECQR
jgi:hypothetical protein